MELINSFEVKLNNPDNGSLTLDEEYFRTREGQCKMSFIKLSFENNIDFFLL